MDKWICIKKYEVKEDSEYHQPEVEFTFYVGDRALIKEYNYNGDIFIGPEGKNTDSAIPMWLVDKHVYNYFITAAQWREQQINSIIND